NQNTRATLDSARRVTLAAGEVFLDAAPRPKDRAGTVVVKTPRGGVTGRAARLAVRTAAGGPLEVVAPGRVQGSGINHAGGARHHRRPENGSPRRARRVPDEPDPALHEVPPPAAPLAQESTHTGGGLSAVDPHAQEAKPRPCKYHDDAHIEDGCAPPPIDQ